MLYYTAPSDEAFNDMKQAALGVWKQYDNANHPGGYYEEKVARIKDIQNIQDNFMYMFAMFDMDNQSAVVLRLSEETKQALRERMVEGGSDRFYLLAIGL